MPKAASDSGLPRTGASSTGTALYSSCSSAKQFSIHLHVITVLDACLRNLTFIWLAF